MLGETATGAISNGLNGRGARVGLALGSRLRDAGRLFGLWGIGLITTDGDTSVLWAIAGAARVKVLRETATGAHEGLNGRAA